MASEKGSMISYLQNSVCICVNEDFLCIGQVQFIQDDMSVVLLKDARFITLNQQEQGIYIGIPEIVSSVTSESSFTSICKTMSTPIEYFAFNKPKYVLSVVNEIKQLYMAATKNDKTTIRQSNKSWKIPVKNSWEV